MLFSQRFWSGLADGTITRTYRRWTKPQVVAGRDYRSPGGMLHVESIRVIDPATIDEVGAAAAGYADAEALRRDLRGEPGAPVYEIVFRAAGADPRDALAADDDLDHAAVAEITRRLDRLDRASASGPWTHQVLEAIAARPGVRAGDLAASFGRELHPFKLDVRKLKALGLTISLDVGYRLSPRGLAYRRLRDFAVTVPQAWSSSAATWTNGYALLVGGARSGKSRLAVELAEASGRSVVYVATAEPGDADMVERIDRHRAERPSGWATVEEPIDLATALGRVGSDAFVVVDCLTLWVANLVFADRPDDDILTAATALASALAARRVPSVVVTNEVGLGVHPDTELGRRYRDLLGGVNRAAAACAWRSLFVVAGRALRLDDPHELLR